MHSSVAMTLSQRISEQEKCVVIERTFRFKSLIEKAYISPLIEVMR